MVSSSLAGDRSAVQDVVEAEQGLPEPDVGVGQVHQSATSGDPDQQEVPAGGPIAQVHVQSMSSQLGAGAASCRRCFTVRLP